MEKFRIFSFLFLLLFPFSISSVNSSDVIINEIAWMGTEVSFNNEWIELYNNTNQAINLDGWILKADDGLPNINLAGTIPANGFFILERTDDNALPEISANQIYTGALDNNGENLKLYDNLGNLIDSVDCSDGWFAGDNLIKQTMERKDPKLSGSDPDNWQTSQNPGGTPKTQNSNEGEIQPNLKQLQKTSIAYPSNIFINEILPSPEGPDIESEWIEILNKNNFEVDISGWKIKDEVGKINTHIFPEKTTIPGEGFILLKRPESKITLNNNGDGLLLIQPNGKIADKISYEKALLNQSYSRTESGWLWTKNMTPGAPNIIHSENSNTKKQNQKSISRKEIASIVKPLQKISAKQNSDSFSLFLPAFTIAIFSGIIIFILKKYLIKKKDG